MHHNHRVMLAIMSSMLLSLCACQPIASTELSSAANPATQVVIQGESADEEVIQTIEIDNCDGKSDATRTEQRTQSIEVTISAEVAAKIGASAEVVSAEVQAAVGAAIGSGAQRSTSIQLSAPPGTRMLFQLLWIGKEQVGIVQNLRGSGIPIAFQIFTPTDVRIKSQQDIGCPGSGSSQPVVTSQPSPTQPEVASTLSRPSPIHVINGENYSMPRDWTWVCTGDFSTQVNGIKKAWYDLGVSNTGLVLVLQPDSNFTISGPFEVPVGMDVGDCLPYAQDEKDSGISSAVSAQLDRGCGSKCEYVNVIELDKNGNKVNDYWMPQKP